jgi:arylsulfatase
MAERPHVLVVTTDHWPAALLGVAGHATIQTSTLDQLARNGVRYTNAYSECPVCIPARRTLMTGTTPRTHGDRIFKVQEPMPDLPTLAQAFRDGGYQAYGVGKLHVFPQRNRIGFDDVVLTEEGRPILGAIDDYDIWLGEEGHAGESYGHGMSNNDYAHRPWHLPEHTHVTNWATREMCRMIRRRDPTRPGFWYLSYCHPHPPLVPLASYLDLYRDVDPVLPVVGEWAAEMGSLPYALCAAQAKWGPFTPQQIRGIHRAFFALCTHIDHQLRLVIGTLREEQLLDNTVILFTSDHGDMLGNHGLWAKRLFYEQSANVPMILMGAAGDPRVGHHRVDERLVGWQDVMPTLLDLAGLEIPTSVDGLSMVGAERRAYLYGECGEDAMATRMIRERRHKLIYYPVGDYTQLFDLETDPEERHNLAGLPDYAEIEERLTRLLIDELYGEDETWLHDGQLIGLPDQQYQPKPDRGLSGQRGIHWPPPPLDLSGKPVGAPG